MIIIIMIIIIIIIIFFSLFFCIDVLGSSTQREDKGGEGERGGKRRSRKGEGKRGRGQIVELAADYSLITNII